MLAFDYLKPFLLFSKKKRIPHDMIRYIYSFILEEIKSKLLTDYINNSISSHINYYKRHIYYYNKSNYTLHFDIIPYFKDNADNRIKLKKNVIEKINSITNDKYCFSHYCCNDKGVVFKNRSSS
tara:strand:+ start:2675 stop:3046 length:372 start_codon:yes stop_codon:yes gene_type:complete